MLDYRNAPPDGQPQSFPLTRAPKVCSKSARATLIAFFCILAPATDGTAQAWNEGLTDSFFSVGVSFGGGTFASLHLEAHFLASGKDTDGNDMRKAGVEVVLGFPRHEVAPGNKDFAVSLGTNVRITGRAGISGIAGFRTLVWTPPDAGGGVPKSLANRARAGGLSYSFQGNPVPGGRPATRTAGRGEFDGTSTAEFS